MEAAYDRETLRAVVAGRYLQGRCTAFAIALSRRTGWSLVALRGSDGRLWHSGCRAPGGYADVRGILDADGFREGFGGSDIVPADEGGLLADHPQGDDLIEEADLHAELLFDLPGRSARRALIEDFAVALDALCRSHGVYLRGPGAGVHDAFVAYRAYGDEGGFDVRMFPVGGALLTRRMG